MNQLPPIDIMSLVLNTLDVPEVTALRPASRLLNKLISQNDEFITTYNRRQNPFSWTFTYSVTPPPIYAQVPDVGVIYGVRDVDGRRISTRLGDGDWNLLDMSDSFLLFHNNIEFFVVDPFARTVDSVFLPQDFPPDPFLGDFHVQFSTDEGDFTIVYAKVVGNVPRYYEYRSVVMQWTVFHLELADHRVVEVDQSRNIVFKRLENEADVMYTVFFVEGDEVPWYKRVAFVNPDIDEDDEDFVDPMRKLQKYCGVWRVELEYVDDEEANIMHLDNMRLYRRNVDGTPYSFVDIVPDEINHPIRFSSLSLKEVNGILHIGLQTNAFIHAFYNVNAAAFIFRYDIQNGEWLDNRRWNLRNGGIRHERAVFTNRLTLPMPFVGL